MLAFRLPADQGAGEHLPGEIQASIGIAESLLFP
jgi:hypothetical protein